MQLRGVTLIGVFVASLFATLLAANVVPTHRISFRHFVIVSVSRVHFERSCFSQVTWRVLVAEVLYVAKDYPGRVDRGTLLGAEGGRIPGDDGITLDVPSGATAEPLHATAASITDLAQFGAIAGFRIVSGFTLTLTRASEPPPIEGIELAAPTLLTPAKATLSTQDSGLIAEILPNTPFGVIFRMVALVKNGVTQAIDSTQLRSTESFATAAISCSPPTRRSRTRTDRYATRTASRSTARASRPATSAFAISRASTAFSFFPSLRNLPRHSRSSRERRNSATSHPPSQARAPMRRRL